MSKVTYTDGIAIWKLAYYSFALVGSIIVSWRHGFGKNSGWIYLAIFSTIRIINSSAQIATISFSSPTAETVALITGLLGLSPLLLASLGLLSRVYYSIFKMPWNFIFSFVVLKAVQTPAAIALILCIVGATSAPNPESIDKEGTIQAGVVIFLVVYILIVVLTFGATVGSRMTGRGERKLLLAVTCSLPVLLVRIIYSMLTFFSGKKVFSPANTSSESTTAELFLATTEEMVVVLIYIWVGLSSQSVPPEMEDKSTANKIMHRAGRGDFGTGKLGILGLLTAGVAGFREHRRKEMKRDEPNV
jgi:hypothetical protein